jgi:hypothetical protein
MFSVGQWQLNLAKILSERIGAHGAVSCPRWCGHGHCLGQDLQCRRGRSGERWVHECLSGEAMFVTAVDTTPYPVDALPIPLELCLDLKNNGQRGVMHQLTPVLSISSTSPKRRITDQHQSTSWHRATRMNHLKRDRTTLQYYLCTEENESK